jgi:hypothetical protein
MFRRYGIAALDDKVAAFEKLEAYEQRQSLQNRYNPQENLKYGLNGGGGFRGAPGC